MLYLWPILLTIYLFICDEFSLCSQADLRLIVPISASRVLEWQTCTPSPGLSFLSCEVVLGIELGFLCMLGKPALVKSPSQPLFKDEDIFSSKAPWCLFQNYCLSITLKRTSTSTNLQPLENHPFALRSHRLHPTTVTHQEGRTLP